MSNTEVVICSPVRTAIGTLWCISVWTREMARPPQRRQDPTSVAPGVPLALDSGALAGCFRHAKGYASRIHAHGSSARCKDAEIILDTDVNGRSDAFNPAELLLAAIAACMIKGMERIAPMNHFKYRGVEVRLHGVRQDSPPFMSSITYELIVDIDEDDRRLDLMHYNVRKFGTVFKYRSCGNETGRQDRSCPKVVRRHENGGHREQGF